jgi:hypothetical protein
VKFDQKVPKTAARPIFSSLLGGGLEPDFRVLFSAMFHGVSLGNFHQGRNLWKWAEAKVWSFVVNLPTNCLRVLIIVCLSTGC